MTKQWVELEGKQLELYEQMRDRMVAQVGEMERVTASIIIAKIMRLKQIAVSQELLNPEPSLKRFKKSAKIKALMDVLRGSGEQGVVVFTQYQKAAECVKKLLKKEGIECGILHGGIGEKDRQNAINKFQNGETKVFIATIKAGGLGINLTAGSIAVFLDKDWTPANNNQAIDRLHRIGQENNVTVVELLAKNTIEEYIEEMLENKQKMFDSLVEGKMTGKELLLNLFPDN
ncbi:MAG TPA: C-terminal helicase domain-containing protein, partial [Candidatus Nanoarchaeia archaeon]|nr:C-terminal helicase domain-containing protein [Candidatus Nanoarchaeia archaeon]